MNCKNCGSEIELSYSNKDSLIKKQMCFSCDFWDEHLRAFQNFPNRQFSIDRHLYWDGGDGRTSLGTKGFGGNRWYIVLNNGQKITTDNLWSNGDIPKIWIEKFPTNARFVTKEEFEAK